MSTAATLTNDDIRSRLAGRPGRRAFAVKPATFGHATGIKAILAADPVYNPDVHYCPIVITADKRVIVGEGISGTFNARQAADAAREMARSYLGAIPGFICCGDTKVYAYRADADTPKTIASMWVGEAYDQRAQEADSARAAA